MPLTNRDSKYSDTLARDFAVASFVSLLIVVTALVGLHGYIATNTIRVLAETMNLSVARAGLHSVENELLRHLEPAAVPAAAVDRALSPASPLAARLRETARQAGLRRLKLYDRDGYVVFSTVAAQIGRRSADNPRFRSAIDGHPASLLIYRDPLNPFTSHGPEDNTIQTYLPLVDPHTGNVVGVFEVYSDISRLVERAEYTQLLLLPLAMLVLVVVYLVLFLVVRRVTRETERQETILRERSATLELLSARLLAAQDDERKRLAALLHEDIAQMLVAIKTRIEAAASGALPERKPTGTSVLVSHIQGTIDRIRAEALRLRPSGLDDFGLLRSLASLFERERSSSPGKRLRLDTHVAEDRIPPLLKSIVYRIVQDALQYWSLAGDASEIAVEIRGDSGVITLRITDDAFRSTAGEQAPIDVTADEGSLLVMRERILLSGGQVDTQVAATGRRVTIATWQR